jgi:nitroreductase
MKMTLQDAIKARHSVRAYTGQPLNDDDARALEEKINELNREGRLHIQLIRNEPKAFLGPFARYGKFRGVTDYLVMIGKNTDDLDYRIGYYGEQLVLYAQTLGLNTCWVGLSYTKIPGTYVLGEDEKIGCYISIGYGETQGVSHKIKRIDQVSNVSDDSPEWFRRGVEAALLAPTAINQQKFSFELMPAEEGQPARVLAKRHFSLVGYTQMDLGIAKYHFELGAGKENFQWA